MSAEGEKGSGKPGDADRRALMFVQHAMGIVAEIALDLDITWHQSRDLFAQTLFKHAEDRYTTAPRVAAALDTSVRTVKEYRSRRRASESDTPEFNARRKVLELLEERESVGVDEVTQAMPTGSDVDFTRNALRSLENDGLIEKDASGRIRRRDEFVPWYLRTATHPSERHARVFGYLARLLASRVSRKRDVAEYPATILSMALNIPKDDLGEFSDELIAIAGAFDARWQERSDARPEAEKVLAGGVTVLGRLGEPVDDEILRELQKVLPDQLPFDDEVGPTLSRHFDADGNPIRPADDTGGT